MVPIYERKITHAGLKKFHVLRGKDPDALRLKAEALMAQWDDMWERRKEAERKRLAKEKQAQGKEQMLALAEAKTEEATNATHRLETILSSVIGTNTEILWERLKDHLAFPRPRPDEPHYPVMPFIPDPVYPIPPTKPDRPDIPTKPVPPAESERVSPDEPRFQPEISILDRLVPGRARQKQQEAEALFLQEQEVWNQKVRAYNEEVNRHNAYLIRLKESYHEEKAQYPRLKAEYEAECKRLDRHFLIETLTA
jgi:restriction system protein